MKGKNVDMINGSLYLSTLRYTIPIIATFLLSQLFSVTDLIVVGHFCGSHAVAAIGSTGSLVTLIVNLFFGIAGGAGIVTAYNYGAKDEKMLERVVHTAFPMAVFMGLILTAIGLTCTRGMLNLMNTPKEIIDDAALYLRIYFAGIVMRMVYAYGFTILRAVGDSKTPLVYLTTGGVLNVAFNLFFVLVCGMSVDGVAYGTLISEGVTSFLCIRTFLKRNDALKFSFSKIKGGFNLQILKKIVKIGIPSGISSSMFSISTVLLQSSVNSFGPVVVAGNSAAANLGAFTYIMSSAPATTASNFMGQNLGAKRFDRIKRLPFACVLWAVSGTAIFALITYLLSRPLLGLYITDSEEAIRIGTMRLMIVGLTYVFGAVMETFGGLLRGMSKTFVSMMISIVTICVLRVTLILTLFRLPQFHHVGWLYAVYPISWLISSIVYIIYYRYTLRRMISMHAFAKSQSEGSLRMRDKRHAEEGYVKPQKP